MVNCNERLFIALWPDEATRQALRACRDAWPLRPQASPVDQQKLHLTLHFLGDVAAERVAELERALQLPFTPFEITLDRYALWQHGVAVLEPDAAPMPAALRALHASTENVLRGLGHRIEERPYRPHVTLARRAGAVSIPPLAAPLIWRVDGYALVASRAGRYEVLRSYCQALAAKPAAKPPGPA